jgi:CBS domain containing-hemolysin-like protein
MDKDYAPKAHIPLASGTIVEHPPDMPELVHMDDPAKFVFIDFTNSRPMTVSSDVSIDAAMNKMKATGSHLLLVTDDNASIIGQITACDIMGDAPVRLAGSSGINHSEVTVEMIMTPQKDIKVIEWSNLTDSKVGHIVATMHHLECCDLPVVEDGKVRGLFCASEISRHLGRDISETTMCAHSLAEMIHTLG